MARELEEPIFVETERVFHALHREGHTLPHPEQVTFGLGGRCSGAVSFADFHRIPDLAGFWLKATTRLRAPHPEPISAFLTALIEQRVQFDDAAITRDWDVALVAEAGRLHAAQQALDGEAYHRHLLWWTAADFAAKGYDGDPRHGWVAVRAMMALTATGSMTPFSDYFAVR